MPSPSSDFVITGGSFTPGYAQDLDGLPFSVSVTQQSGGPSGTDLVAVPAFVFPASDLPFSVAVNQQVGDPGTAFVAIPDFVFPADEYVPLNIFSLVIEEPGSNLIGELYGVLDDVAGAFQGVSVGLRGNISGQLEDLVGGFICEYDPNVHRFTTSSVTARVDDSQRELSATLMPMGKSTPTIGLQTVPLEGATATSKATLAQVGNNLAIANSTASWLDIGEPLNLRTLVAFEQLFRLHLRWGTDYDQTTPLIASAQSGLEQLTLQTVGLKTLLQDTLDSLSLAGVSYYLEDVPVPVYVPTAYFSFSSLPDITDDREAEPYGLLPFVFSGGYTPGNTFTPSGVLNVGGGNPPYAAQNIDIMWPGVVSLHTFAGYDKGLVKHSVGAHIQVNKLTGLEILSKVQEARQPWTGGSTWVPGGVIYPPPPPPTDPPGHTTLTIPTQDAYIMLHSLSVTLLDLTPISMGSVNLSLDADSFAWQFSGTLLDKADLVKVQQVGVMEPVQLIITVNGYTWKVLVERIEHSRQFAQKSITLSGRGLTALLGQPYEQPSSATQSSALTVQQLAELQLPVGWTLVWSAPTWLVPSGAYSYNSQTPIQALGSLVSDIGAMLVPSPNSQSIEVMPRYPVLPWDFANLSPDVTIPESVITELSQRPVIPYQANGVYVHGTEIGGTLAWCRLNGTDGARLAGTVSNALMTDPIACRALGGRIIAGQYAQPAIRSLTLPMDGVTVPLLEVGQFAQITVDSVPVRGIINSVSIEVSLGHVRQSIQIGEETPNTWAMFKELLPRDPLLVATLAETDGTTSLMTLLDTGVVRVRGTGTVGNKYYIRSGKIDGAAPLMTQDEIIL